MPSREQIRGQFRTLLESSGAGAAPPRARRFSPSGVKEPASPSRSRNQMQLTPERLAQPETTRPFALDNLPPYRPVARKLMQLAAIDDVPLAKVQDLLRTDAAFSAEVLK